MMNKIKTFLWNHRNNPFIKILYKIKDDIEGKRANKRLKKLNKIVIQEDRKLRVVFLVFDSNTWNKVKSLYLEMKNSNKIEAFLVCCPEPYKDDTAKTYNYFVTEGYDCIDARIGNGPWNAIEKTGDWFDIEELKPDYVFYAEPYNMYLPPKYRSNVVSSYAKICIVKYGYAFAEEFLKMCPIDFYRDVYLNYATNIDEQNYNLEYFKHTREKGLQHFKYLGFLAYSDFVKQKGTLSKEWAFSSNKFRAIWTPRWTTDKKAGGTNFFRYKDVLLNLAVQNENSIDFLFRPHPMAFDYFLRNGEMTQAELDEFLNYCAQQKNVNIDRSSNYVSTFWSSSFLVTDISSVIVEYFMTGKPIIFCTSQDVHQNFLPCFQKIIENCYTVNNERELIDTINYLKSGNDEKRENRNNLIAEIFGDSINAPKNILNDILNDAKGIKN